MNARVSLALRRSVGRSIAADQLAADLRLPARRLAAAVDELGRLGFVIEMHPMLGLRLLGVPPALFEIEIAAGLPVSRIGRHVRCDGEVASTNDLAWEIAASGRPAADGLAVFAEHQTAGRGRRGSRWLSPPHASLLASIVLWVPDEPSYAAVLTRAAAVATAEAIEACTSLKVGIKWPNDLVVEDRKVGGILVEAHPAAGEMGPVVIGIGVNCSQGPEAFPAEIRPAVASLAMLGEEVDRTLLARSLLEHLDGLIARSAEPAGRDDIRRQAVARCRTLGRRVTLAEGGTTSTGEVIDLDPDYGLVLRLPEGGIRRFPAMTTHVVAW